MKKKNDDMFPAKAFCQELENVRMTDDIKSRALSCMKGERKAVRRKGYAFAIAMLLILAAIGGTLALSGINDADKQNETMLTLSQPSAVIPGKDGMGSTIFTLEDALYDGERVLISYRLENNGQTAPHADMQSDAMRFAYKVEEPLNRTDSCIADTLRACMEKNGAQSAVRHEWIPVYAQTEDGLRMDRWCDMYQVDGGDMHYLWMELNEEHKGSWDENGNWTMALTQQDAAENVWLNRDEITLRLLFYLEEDALVLDADGQETLYDGIGNEYYSIPVTIRRTDEIEKRTVQDGVIEIAENTFFIRATEDTHSAVLTFHDLSYDGSSIFMQYSVAGGVFTRMLDRADLESRLLLDMDPMYIERMDQLETKVYDVLIRGRNKAVGGLAWGVDVYDVMDAQGQSLEFYVAPGSAGQTIYDPVNSIPERLHRTINLNVTPAAEGIGDHLARHQTLIDKDEITVMFPLVLEFVNMIQENGQVRYSIGYIDTDIAVPVTISRSENRSLSAPWKASLTGEEYISVWAQEWKVPAQYIVAETLDETHEVQLALVSPNSITRAYNVGSDIEVRLLAQADDPYGYLAWAQDFLDMDIDVNSVLLRLATPGTPVLKDGTSMEAYLDVRAEYDRFYERWVWTYAWKEDADLSVFAGMDRVEMQIPATEVRIYAKYDDRGRIYAGMESIPVPGDSLTAEIMLP